MFGGSKDASCHLRDASQNPYPHPRRAIHLRSRMAVYAPGIGIIYWNTTTLSLHHSGLSVTSTRLYHNDRALSCMDSHAREPVAAHDWHQESLIASRVSPPWHSRGSTGKLPVLASLSLPLSLERTFSQISALLSFCVGYEDIGLSHHSLLWLIRLIMAHRCP